MIVVIFLFSLLIIYIPIITPFIQSLYCIKWYVDLIVDYEIWLSVLNSIIIALISSTLGIIISIFNIYSHLYYISLFPLLVPEIIIGITLLIVYGNIINEFVLLIIGHMTLVVAYASTVLRSAYKKNNPIISEAASDLGASDFDIFIKVTIPVLVPAIFESWCLGISVSLDDMILSSLLSNVRTFPVELYSRLKIGAISEINALLTVLFILFFITFLIFRKNK